MLLLGVLSGMLFSSGEGIRLFPFALSQNSPKAVSEHNAAGTYQKNIFRIDKERENQSKFQRKIPADNFTGIFNSPNNFRLILLASLPESRLSGDFQPAKSIEVSKDGGSRAPPLSGLL